MHIEGLFLIYIAGGTSFTAAPLELLITNARRTYLYLGFDPYLEHVHPWNSSVYRILHRRWFEFVDNRRVFH